MSKRFSVRFKRSLALALSGIGILFPALVWSTEAPQAVQLAIGR